MFRVVSPLQYFTDLDGSPLTNGFLYFGIAATNPELSANTLTVYWDENGTQAAAQPIRTINGHPVRNGAAAQLFIPSSCSLTVRNRNNALVSYFADSKLFTDISPWGSGVLASYISANEFSVSGDQTNTFRKGERVKCTGGEDRYMTIVSSSYAAPLTTVTVQNITDNASTPSPASLHANTQFAYLSVSSNHLYSVPYGIGWQILEQYDISSPYSSSAPIIIKPGGHLNITAATTLSGDILIEPGGQLTAAAALTATGKITNLGTMTVSTASTVAADISISGLLTSSAANTFSGDIVVNAGGQVSVTVDTTFSGDVSAVSDSAFTTAAAITTTFSGTFTGNIANLLTGDGTYTITGTSPAKYPQWFGVVGDGVTDDSAGFRLWATELETNGGNAVIPPKTYLVSQDGANNWCFRVNGGSNLTVTGYGATLKDTVGSTQIIRFASIDNLTVKGLSVLGLGSDGTNEAQGLLQVDGGTIVKIIDCNSKDSDADGIAVANATDVIVTGCTSNNDSKAGIYVNGCTNALVTNNHVKSFGGHTVSSNTVGSGIQLSSNSYLTCENNIVNTGIGVGIYCTALTAGARPYMNKIQNNIVISATNPTNVSVSGGINCVNGNASKDTGTVVSGNLLFGNGVYNIYIENHGGFECKNNNCIESNRGNIVISSITDGVVSENSCINTNTSNTASQYAIHLINTATGVIVRDNEYIDSTLYATSYGGHRPFDGSSGANSLLKRIMNSGTATILNATTSISVTHSATVTPNIADIMVTPQSNKGSASEFWVSAVGATTFDINVDADPGANIGFSWQITGF